MMRLGTWEIVLIAVVVLLIFGPSKLPGLGKGIAEFFKNFKSGIKEVDKEVSDIKSKIEDKSK